MHRLTRKQERFLRHTSDGVRMSIMLLTVIGWGACLVAASEYYTKRVPDGEIPEIPATATWGNITGIYLPLFAVMAGYLWATRGAPNRNLAPNGFAMALFRDVFTVVFAGVVLLIPWVFFYRDANNLRDVNGGVVWYQTVLTTVLGGVFVYYFHGRISAEKPEEKDTAAPAESPKRKAPRRRKPAPAVPDAAAPAAAAAPEPASTTPALEG